MCGDNVLTGDSFFHLAAYGDPLPGLNLCGAGRVVCLIDPVGDVYACPFAIHESFLAGNVRGPGGFAAVWRESELFERGDARQHAPQHDAHGPQLGAAGPPTWQDQHDEPDEAEADAEHGRAMRPLTAQPTKDDDP